MQMQVTVVQTQMSHLCRKWQTKFIPSLSLQSFPFIFAYKSSQRFRVRIPLYSQLFDWLVRLWNTISRLFKKSDYYRNQVDRQMETCGVANVTECVSLDIQLKNYFTSTLYTLFVVSSWSQKGPRRRLWWLDDANPPAHLFTPKSTVV